jgi:hypothetical protein
MSDIESVSDNENEVVVDKKTEKAALYKFLTEKLGRETCPICEKKNVMLYRIKEHMKSDHCLKSKPDFDRKTFLEGINEKRKKFIDEFNRNSSRYYKIKLTLDELEKLPVELSQRMIPIKNSK